MKVIAKRMFDDLKEGVRRNKGDVFDIEESRFEKIEAALPGYIEKYEEKKVFGKVEK